LTFVGVDLYPPMGQHETLELPSLNPECALPGVEHHIGPSEGFEHLLKVFHMLVERGGGERFRQRSFVRRSEAEMRDFLTVLCLSTFFVC